MRRRHFVIEIEDVSEPFNGCRRRNMVPLAHKEPEIAAEWYYENNCGWGPEDFSHASSVRAWWKCPKCLRAYQSVINSRTSKQRSACPYCASKRVCEENALVTRFPEVAKEWHPTKNKKYKVSEVMHASGKRAWWLCKTCNHEWETAVADRTVMQSGCPACYAARMEYARLHPKRTVSPQVVLGAQSEAPSKWYDKPSSANFVSLYQFSKNLARQWHPSKNGEISPLHIAKGSDAIAWWKCSKGVDHEWQAPVYSRTSKKSGCPFCSNHKVSVTNNLAKVAPELAKEWHPTKNGKLKPKDVIAGGKIIYWWRCRKDEAHEWQSDIYRRIKGDRCPYCTHQRVSKENCLNREFAYIAAQLHPTKNGTLTGDDIAVQSGKKVWWKCDKGPDHEWMATPANRTGRASGCPACAGKQTSITNCLATLSPATAKQWDKKRNGKLSPQTISPHSKILVWWLCEKGHSWQQMVRKRVTSPVACWQCSGKTAPGVPPKKRSSQKTQIKIGAPTRRSPSK